MTFLTKTKKVFTDLKIKDNLLSVDRGQYLSDSYVYCETLDNVEDIWDALNVWSDNAILKSDTERLRALLTKHQYRSGSARLTHSNIIIEVPGADYAHNRIVHKYANSNQLIAELTELHKKEFSMPPRYQVNANYDLQDKQIRIRFGMAVYVPSKDEMPKYDLELSTTALDETWQKHAVYEEQRLITIGKTLNIAAIAVPKWPFLDSQELILVNELGSSTLEIESHPHSELDVKFNKELNYYIISAKSVNKNNGEILKLYLRCTLLNATGDSSKIKQAEKSRLNTEQMPKPVVWSKKVDAEVIQKNVVEKLEPVLSNPQSSLVKDKLPDSIPMHSIANKTVKPTNQDSLVLENSQDVGGTFVPLLPVHAEGSNDEGTWLVELPKRAHYATLNLIGIALQKVSAYKNAGYEINALNFGMSSTGRILLPGQNNCHFDFTVNERDDVFVKSRGNSQPLMPNQKLPLPNDSIVQLSLLPEEAEIYLGFILLPEVRSVNLEPSSEIMIGRNQTHLRDLHAFNGKGFIEAEGQPMGDFMGISSKHASLRMMEDKLMLTLLSSTPTYILTPEFEIFKQLKQGDCIEMTSGQSILFGHYIWQFLE